MPHQCLTKGLALARPVERLVKAGLGKPQRRHRHGQAFAVEVAHDHLEARARLADQVARRHAHVVKVQLRGVRAHASPSCAAANASAPRCRPAPPARRCHGHRASVACRARHGPRIVAKCRVVIGAHGHRQVVGPHARGDEGLLAVDHIIIAVAPRGGAERRHVRAAARLGDCQRCDLSRRATPAGTISRCSSVDPWRTHRRQTDVVREQAGEHAATGAVSRHRNSSVHCACVAKPAYHPDPPDSPCRAGRSAPRACTSCAEIRRLGPIPST